MLHEFFRFVRPPLLYVFLSSLLFVSYQTPCIFKGHSDSFPSRYSAVTFIFLSLISIARNQDQTHTWILSMCFQLKTQQVICINTECQNIPINLSWATQVNVWGSLLQFPKKKKRTIPLLCKVASVSPHTRCNGSWFISLFWDLSLVLLLMSSRCHGLGFLLSYFMFYFEVSVLMSLLLLSTSALCSSPFTVMVRPALISVTCLSLPSLRFSFSVWPFLWVLLGVFASSLCFLVCCCLSLSCAPGFLLGFCLSFLWPHLSPWIVLGFTRLLS